MINSPDMYIVSVYGACTTTPVGSGWKRRDLKILPVRPEVVEWNGYEDYQTLFLFIFCGGFDDAKGSIAFLSLWSTDRWKRGYHLFRHNLWTKIKKKRLRFAREIPILAATLLFLSLMFAVFHNHSPLLTLSRNTTEKTLLNASKKINLPVRNLVFTATFSLKKAMCDHAPQ